MGVAAIRDKLHEKRLGWFGNAMRTDRSHVTRQAMELVAEKGQTKRTKLRWLDKIKGKNGVSAQDT